jgi:hypothetical protein
MRKRVSSKLQQQQQQQQQQKQHQRHDNSNDTHGMQVFNSRQLKRYTGIRKTPEHPNAQTPALTTH